MAENQLNPSVSSDIDDKIDDDSGITMVDVLEEEEELENDANAVLGGSDDKNCTYIEGYVKRQALYACKTCIASENESGGVCLACSYACHEGHDLYELYTKRSFRCDCGNSKFPNNQCQFFKNKANLNESNNYNQNFVGKYCTCSRPYPDVEDDTPDEMIQCIMCEDWYHSKHLSGTLPETDFSELICGSCMNKNSFLWNYYSMPASLNVEENSQPSNSKENGSLNVTKLERNDSEMSKCETNKENDDEKSASVSCLLKKSKNEVEGCTATFWPEGWRQNLCQCHDCMIIYENHGCLYLIDLDDTVQAYEERGKRKFNGESRYDKGLSALNSLGRVQQVEAIHEYNSMKTELKEFLKTFADSKKIVKEEHIHEFFNSIQAKKRRKNVHIPHFCR